MILQPCPKCGETPRLARAQPLEGYFILCENCNECSPYAMIERDAEILWNLKPQPEPKWKLKRYFQ